MNIESKYFGITRSFAVIVEERVFNLPLERHFTVNDLSIPTYQRPLQNLRSMNCICELSTRAIVLNKKRTQKYSTPIFMRIYDPHNDEFPLYKGSPCSSCSHANRFPKCIILASALKKSYQSKN